MTKPKHDSTRKQQPFSRPGWLLPAGLIGIAIIIIGAVIAFLNASQQKPYAAQVSDRPNAEVDQTVLDYGNVRFETPVEAVFHVTNTGDKPLAILGEPRVELLQGC